MTRISTKREMVYDLLSALLMAGLAIWLVDRAGSTTTIIVFLIAVILRLGRIEDKLKEEE